MSEIIQFPGGASVDEVPQDTTDTTLYPPAEALAALFAPYDDTGSPIGYLILVRTHEGNLKLGYGGDVGLISGLGMLEVAKRIILERYSA